MRTSNRFRRCQSTDSLLNFPIQRKSDRIESESEEDSTTSVEETSWSTFSSLNRETPQSEDARRYFAQKQASLVIITESFSSSTTESEFSLQRSKADQMPLTLSTLSQTPVTTHADPGTSSGSQENFSALSTYDDFTPPPSTASAASSSADSRLAGGKDVETSFSSTANDSNYETAESEDDGRLRGGKERMDFLYSDTESDSSEDANSIREEPHSAQSVYYTDKLTLCLNGTCKVFAFDRVNCRCNDSDWSTERRCGRKKQRSCSVVSFSAKSERISSSRPMVEPPLLNDNHKWRYVGVLTHEEAAKTVRSRTDFRLYHQFVPGMDYSGVERLPLAVVYQSSKKRIFHWRVLTVGFFEENDAGALYKCDSYYVENGGPTCRSLNDLLDVYDDHAYNIDGQIESFFVFG